MARAASQAGDADSSRTPGLNSSVQTSIDDHDARYYICHSVPCLILVVKSCEEKLSLNNFEEKCRTNTVGH